MKTTTVEFNVGGTTYEISRSLLERFPDTMLARMVSEIWLKVDNNDDRCNENKDEDKPPVIFVDRNGDRFQYVLDYMRDGQHVALPFAVSREGFLKDLEYYGFQNVDATKISREASLGIYWELDEKVNELDAANDIAILAHYCFVRFKNSREFRFSPGFNHPAFIFSKPAYAKYEESNTIGRIRRTTEAIQNESSKLKRFNYFLGKYGLKAKKIDRCGVVELEILDD